MTTFRTVDCTALETFRAELGVSPLPIVVAALCRIAADHPLLNAAWGGDARRRVDDGHTSGSRSTRERGLVVPVVHARRDARIAALAERDPRASPRAPATARSRPTTSRGATIAVSNTGSYGSEAGTPILSPGTTRHARVRRDRARALVVDGAVVARPAATISLTFDHRVLDGAAAGRALTDLVALLAVARTPGRLPR